MNSFLTFNLILIGLGVVLAGPVKHLPIDIDNDSGHSNSLENTHFGRCALQYLQTLTVCLERMNKDHQSWNNKEHQRNSETYLNTEEENSWSFEDPSKCISITISTLGECLISSADSDTDELEHDYDVSASELDTFWRQFKNRIHYNYWDDYNYLGESEQETR